MKFGAVTTLLLCAATVLAKDSCVTCHLALDGSLKAPADAFVANILAGPLAALEPRFAACVKPRAPIALSGILDGQQQELLDRYSEWFEELEGT